MKTINFDKVDAYNVLTILNKVVGANNTLSFNEDGSGQINFPVNSPHPPIPFPSIDFFCHAMIGFINHKLKINHLNAYILAI